MGWREAELPNLPRWSLVEIPLDLDAAVTMTMTITAELPQEVGGSERSVWIERHERTLVWKMEDTLDGETWFLVAHGVADGTTPAQIARISSPLGTRARLGWWTDCVIASIRKDDGSTQQRKTCNKAELVVLGGARSACQFDHETLKVTNVIFNVAVRCI